MGSTLSFIQLLPLLVPLLPLLDPLTHHPPLHLITLPPQVIVIIQSFHLLSKFPITQCLLGSTVEQGKPLMTFSFVND